MKINSTNITNVLKKMQQSNFDNPASNQRPYIIVCPTVRGPINRERYKGFGRPRNSDYDRITNPIIEDIKQFNSQQ